MVHRILLYTNSLTDLEKVKIKWSWILSVVFNTDLSRLLYGSTTFN